MRVADPGKMFVCCLSSRKAVRQGARPSTWREGRGTKEEGKYAKGKEKGKEINKRKGKERKRSKTKRRGQDSSQV